VTLAAIDAGVSFWPDSRTHQQDVGSLGCGIGLEGIVSKRLDRAYSAGKCKHWIKMNNPRTRPTTGSGISLFSTELPAVAMKTFFRLGA
jgi:hypothetical protein